jgi:hypothetical protein
MFRGPMCADCYAIERAGFKWIAVGAASVILIWGLSQGLYYARVIVHSSLGLIWLALAPMWFFVCLIWTYLRLRKRGFDNEQK